MKVIHICVLNLALMNLVLAQLNRQIALNKEPDLTTIEGDGEETFRTMRSYQTMATGKMVRRTTSIAHVVDKTCLLTPDQGPCRGKIVMWYFDPATMNCSTFYWGGCQGNGNRYDKYSECSSTCLSPPGWKESRPRYCSLTFDYGWCFGADERYFYDHHWGVCKKTIYSGCGGNKNNFHSKENCDAVCRFGTFNLHPQKTKNRDKIKKVLIVNPNIFTEPQNDRHRKVHVTQAVSKRAGSWWMDDFKKKSTNKKMIGINKNESDTLSIGSTISMAEKKW